uniref:Uncharacterized protein n=1 Tax=Clastoptera arizonana TaxID=38151 RepID=A0A1B6D4F5_9HEMI
MCEYHYQCRPYPPVKYAPMEYNPVMFYSHIHSAMDNLASATRHARNLAEKNRRDKLNAYITQLSTLVPIINYSPKKLDKTSILRLAATYIRLHNVIFGKSRNNDPSHFQRNYLPEFLSSVNWSENILEDLGGGMMLIVTGAGKIIFISNAVEKLLGHTQIELMGHSLYSLTCLEDHAELKKNLLPNDSPSTSSSSRDVANLDDSDSDSSLSASLPPPIRQPAQLQAVEHNADPQSDFYPERRSFYVRLRQRAVSKSDHPSYELMHIVGHLRVPKKQISQASTSRKREQPINSNDIVLIGVATPFKEKRITCLSLSEAYREEFITRHAVDGNVIYTDHRISMISGYLAEEVVGVPGFKFMHKDDMRWTMIALRQMYFRGQSYGSSVYRLQTKTGQFIYVKTHGYLEINESSDDVQSFLCINTLVTEEEGIALLTQMKELYTPLIRDNLDSTVSLIVQNYLKTNEFQRKEIVSNNVEDPCEMKRAIQHMLSNITFHPPTSNSTLDSEDKNSQEKFAQISMLAKTLPPINEQAAKLGIPITTLNTSSSSLIVSPSNTNLTISPQQSTPKIPPLSPLSMQLNRPSVLRCGPKSTNFQVPNEVSVVKRIKTDENNFNVVVSENNSVLCHTGVVVSSEGKRKHDEEAAWVPPMSNIVQESGLALTTSTYAYAQPSMLEQPISPSIDLPQVEMDNTFFLDPTINYFNISLSGKDDHSQGHINEEYNFSFEAEQGLGKSDNLSTELYKSHNNISFNLEQQETKITEIEEVMEAVPSIHEDVVNSNTIRLTELKAELERERQTLNTLRQDHQSMQHGLI